jgi:hypothetical protein
MARKGIESKERVRLAILRYIQAVGLPPSLSELTRIVGFKSQASACRYRRALLREGSIPGVTDRELLKAQHESIGKLKAAVLDMRRERAEVERERAALATEREEMKKLRFERDSLQKLYFDAKAQLNGAYHG